LLDDLTPDLLPDVRRIGGDQGLDPLSSPYELILISF